MFGLPRYARMLLILLLVVVLPSLYLIYPHHDPEIAPGSAVREYQAGGIDSEHWRAPVKPDFEHEEARWSEDEDEETGDTSHESGRFGKGSSGSHAAVSWDAPDEKVIGGGVIMPKLENATAKAELGRAAWKVLHLMTLRYPDEPTEDDRLALKSYFHLFSRLYPCGECAEEFQKLLKEFPPQTSSRKSASLWLCHVHNQVNARLGKPEFDCLTLDATYDCGCGPEGSVRATSTSPAAFPQMTKPLMLKGASPFDHLDIGQGLAGMRLKDEPVEDEGDEFKQDDTRKAFAGMRMEDREE